MADRLPLTAARFPWEPVAVGAVLLACWEGGTKALGIPGYLLPQPSSIIATMLAQAGRMLPHLALTLGEALAGFIGGTLLGIGIAFLIAYSAYLRRELQPLLVLSQSMPTTALAPLLVVWVGVGTLPKALLALVLVLFPIAVNMAAGLLQVDPEMLRLLRSYRATAWQVFIKIRFPNAVAYLIAGMKIAAPLALIGAVVGEFVAANRGIGFVILDAGARLATVELMAGIIYVGLAGTGLFLAVGAVEAWLVPWFAEQR